MSAIAADEAHRVVQIRVAEVAPHPFNDPSRSRPKPGDEKWNELLKGVQINGVRLPVLVVPRESFAAVRPAVAEEIAPDARYVLVYGHRRRAAALEAGRETIPAVVDDSIMADDGDIDAMATENLGRQELSDLAECDLFARYYEMGLPQRGIAERLGVDQSTVQRRLALKLLTPEVRAAVESGALPAYEAATLVGKDGLPYGPRRPWQKTFKPEQDTEQRKAEQNAALGLVVGKPPWSVSRATERVIAEREARAEAASLGIELINDPHTEFGDHYTDHRIRRDEFTSAVDVVGAINPNIGRLDLYRRQPVPAGSASDAQAAATDLPVAPSERPTPAPTPATAGPVSGHNDEEMERDTGAGDGVTDPQRDAEAAAMAEQKRAEIAAAAAAQAHRRESCAALITHQPTNAELLKILVRQYLSGVAARSQTSAVNALLRDWDAHADGQGEKALNARAWQRAVAAAELHTAELKDKAWDDEAVAHVGTLIARVGYQPTAWERDQLDTVPR
jgi:ParB family chromosome partitioning protein